MTMLEILVLILVMLGKKDENWPRRSWEGCGALVETRKDYLAEKNKDCKEILQED